MKRPLGQHFLINRRVVHRILQALDLSPQDKVLEIGPGKGALTGPLARRVQKLLLIEKDPRLAEEVRDHLSARENVRVRCEDFLDTPWEEVKAELGEAFKVVSNLPYQAATAILVKLLRHGSPGSLMVLMFQKEVAERLLAEPHSKAFGSLTIFTQIFTTPRKVLEVPPAAFRPPPEVFSTVLKFKFHPQPLLPLSEIPDFEKLLQAGFIHRRKMLRQNLRSYFPGASAAEVEEKLRRIHASEKARAEELSVEQWLQMFQSARPEREVSSL